MPRILRAKASGTGIGGPGDRSIPVAGKINQTGSPRSGSIRDADQLRAFAAIRARMRSAMSRSTIGSRGRL
jgi:hypothetical protein